MEELRKQLNELFFMCRKLQIENETLRKQNDLLEEMVEKQEKIIEALQKINDVHESFEEKMSTGLDLGPDHSLYKNGW